MTRERWKRIEELYLAARKCTANERTLFLDDACGADLELREEIESLLRQDEKSIGLSQPVADFRDAWTSTSLVTTLTPGSPLGPYEIVNLIGAGSMGEVYRARDAKLKREIAIKILPAEFSRDKKRVSRFQREAEILASLNHPNIAAIYDLQQSSDSHFLVLELVEGETLAERIKRRPVPIAEAIDIARQICEALAAAHEKNIVHRDLKPANIKITPDGKVKLLDFGLAKAFAGDGADEDLSKSVVTAATEQGVILGTPAYMSPEQARGSSADARSDIWAFGCVLYEMLTGQPALKGETVSDTIASILKNDPDWTKLPLDTPRDLRRALSRCLQKDVRRRIQNVVDVRIEIDEIETTPGTKQEFPRPEQSKTRYLAWLLMAAAAIVAAVRFGPTILSKTPPLDQRLIRFDIQPPDGYSFLSDSGVSVSPDGSHVAFVALRNGRSSLWIRSLESGKSDELQGTDGASGAFWSPDSRSLGFTADGKLKAIEISGGAPRLLCTFPGIHIGSWNSDGLIIFSASGQGSTLFKTLAVGGLPEPLRIADRSAELPKFLPDGRHFIYRSNTHMENGGLYVASVDSDEVRKVGEIPGTAEYAAPGYLVFNREGAIYAQAFNAKDAVLSGQPFPVADPPSSEAFSLSTNGVMAYRDARNENDLVWLDRKGDKLGMLAASTRLSGPQLSPNGRQAAFNGYNSRGAGTPGIWLMDLPGGAPSPWTSGSFFDQNPVWSPDGRQILYTDDPTGTRFDLYLGLLQVRPSDDELFLTSEFNKGPLDWSTKGYVLFRERDKTGARHLWAVREDDREKRTQITPIAADQQQGQFSPDGDWIAYTSNETGQYEVYVQNFPGVTFKKQISKGGGVQPRWRPDGAGAELFYVASDGNLMSVRVKLSSAQTVGPMFSEPVPLFKADLFRGFTASLNQQFDVTADGQRFLVARPSEHSTQRVAVVVNWSARRKK